MEWYSACLISERFESVQVRRQDKKYVRRPFRQPNRVFKIRGHFFKRSAHLLFSQFAGKEQKMFSHPLIASEKGSMQIAGPFGIYPSLFEEVDTFKIVI
jgi:hypothetical protein